MLDELEKGPWPSFVTDIKKAADRKPDTMDLLHLLELSYKEKIGHWKHGGIVGVMGYGGGVIGRYTDRPDLFPGVKDFHTIRVNMPTGWFYTSESLRKICDIWDKFGSGMTNFHGSTGDIILLGTNSDSLQPCFDALSEAGFDLGGSGSDLRTPSACCGMARCEWACYDSLQVCYDVTMKYQMELHRPMWPYKFKVKCSGCPNDCVAAVARADCSIIGTWRDDIQVNKDEVAKYAAGGVDLEKDVANLCPTKCIQVDGKAIKIDNANCTRCMHCINVMPKALKPGKERGATMLIGAKAPILMGARLSSVVIPFIELEKLQPPYEWLFDFMERLWEWWDENGKFRERIGEMIDRVGMRSLLKAMDIEPIPQMISEPRTNPFVFWNQEEVEGGAK
ncbi:MAG: dissimilatory-type sulfite reductase subunit alpha [Candidatus Latescibacterota bacterium]